jgi:hypothetical protein
MRIRSKTHNKSGVDVVGIPQKHNSSFILDATNDVGLAENPGKLMATKSFSDLYLEGSPARKYENAFPQLKDKIK